MGKADIDRATREAAAKRREARQSSPPEPAPFDFLDSPPPKPEPLQMTEGPVDGLVGRVREAKERTARVRARLARSTMEGPPTDEAIDAKMVGELGRQASARRGGRPKLAQEEKVGGAVGFLLRCSPEEKAAWCEAGLNKGSMSLTAWIRDVCNEAAKGGGR